MEAKGLIGSCFDVCGRMSGVVSLQLTHSENVWGPDCRPWPQHSPYLSVWNVFGGQNKLIIKIIIMSDLNTLEILLQIEQAPKYTYINCKSICSCEYTTFCLLYISFGESWWNKMIKTLFCTQIDQRVFAAKTMFHTILTYSTC